MSQYYTAVVLAIATRTENRNGALKQWHFYSQYLLMVERLADKAGSSDLKDYFRRAYTRVFFSSTQSALERSVRP
jgi:hypothetical protein